MLKQMKQNVNPVIQKTLFYSYITYISYIYETYIKVKHFYICFTFILHINNLLITHNETIMSFCIYHKILLTKFYYYSLINLPIDVSE